MASTLADLKAALMECLKEFKAANYAIHLCNLLIKTQDLHEEIVDHAQGNLEQYRLQHERCTVGYIKEIVERGFADKIMGTILEALDAPKEERLNEKTKQVSTFLSDSECAKEPSEYLKLLINSVESVVEVLFDTNYLACYRRDLIGCEKRKLVVLKVCLMNRPAKFISDQLLLEIFRCCLNPCDFSLNEKKEIVFAVIDGISLIQELTRVASLHFHYRIDIAQLQRRSALQFLKELFDECLKGEEEMLNKRNAELNTAIQRLDDDISMEISFDIERAEKCSEKEDYVETSDDIKEADAWFLPTKEDYLETLDDFEEAGACFVPATHTWWQKYKDAYFP